MIYFYQRIPSHPIERQHQYLHHFFMQLFYDNPPDYSHDHYIDPDFKEIVLAHKDSIDNTLEKIYQKYSVLNQQDRMCFKNAYYTNTNIKGICDGTIKPVKYSDLPISIRAEVEKLYGTEGILWKQLSVGDPEKYKKIKAKCGNIKNHFIAFRQHNVHSLCPFCGMMSLLNEHDDLRNAYDHYIPKSEYPFCSILFDNFFPICDQCNKSGNKGSKDIPYDENKQQRALYYPYDSIPNHVIKLK